VCVYVWWCVESVGCELSGEGLREMVDGGVEERRRREGVGGEGQWEWKLRELDLNSECVCVVMIIRE